MPKRLILSVLAACVVTAVLTTIVVTNLDAPPASERPVLKSSVRSTVLSEQRDLLINLPDGYERDGDRRYPVLYVLDGSSQAEHTAESARLLARIGAMPDVIVVGLPSSGENRARDYTPPTMPMGGEKNGPSGEAHRFLQFLETELIPHVERTYRTTSTRMLAGNSRGGLFVVYSLLEKPALFNARFAYSPALWRDEDRIVAELEESLKTPLVAPTFLYLSLGDGENEKMTRAFRKTVAVLRTSASPSLRWRADITAGADHGTNARVSTPVGLAEYGRSRSWDNDTRRDPNADPG